jgi:hypothetical protein
MDSLGGILTKGLLGNPILGRFNLGGFFNIEVIEQPVEVGGAGYGGNTTHLARREEKRREEKRKEKIIVVSIRLDGMTYRKPYLVSDRTATVSINILDRLTKLKESVIGIKSIFVREKKDDLSVTVRIKDDRNQT